MVFISDRDRIKRAVLVGLVYTLCRLPLLSLLWQGWCGTRVPSGRPCSTHFTLSQDKLRIDRDLSAAFAAVVLISDCDSMLRIDRDLSAASRLWYSFLTATA